MVSTARWRDYALLMRLDKPIGIYLLLWPTLWGLWFAAEGMPRWSVLLVFALGVLLMRSAGCVINDYADRDIDGHVERTKERPIAVGRVSPKEALILFAVLCLLAFALVLTMNPLTVLLSPVGAFLAASYPFMKRFTHLPQAYLGAAFGWSIPMAWAAQNNTIEPVAWALFAATLLWAVAYDTMYAMVDRDDDLKIGVKSSAILFGRFDRLMVALLQLTVLSILAAVGQIYALAWPYWLGLLAAAGLVGYQLWLIRHRDKTLCFKAFLNNHYFGLVVFLGAAAAFALP